MKEQQEFDYVVTEDVPVKGAETGLVEKMRKRILGKGTITAYDSDNAKIKAQAVTDISKADIDEVKVKIRPFCG